jgi:hypothetical protein
MFDKTKVQEALNRVDGAVSQLQMNRKDHILLVQDMRLLNECCMEYFDDEQELQIVRLQDVRANKQPVDAEFVNEDSKGSGDSVSGN